MEKTYTEEEVKELMLKVFKMGQEKFEADINDSPVRLWIAGVIDEYTSNAESANLEVEDAS